MEIDDDKNRRAFENFAQECVFRFFQKHKDLPVTREDIVERASLRWKAMPPEHRLQFLMQHEQTDNAEVGKRHSDKIRGNHDLIIAPKKNEPPGLMHTPLVAGPSKKTGVVLFGLKKGEVDGPKNSSLFDLTKKTEPQPLGSKKDENGRRRSARLSLIATPEVKKIELAIKTGQIAKTKPAMKIEPMMKTKSMTKADPDAMIELSSELQVNPKTKEKLPKRRMTMAAFPDVEKKPASRKPKDPNAPKRFAGSFSFFVKEYPDIIKVHPHLKEKGPGFKIMSEIYRALPDNDKQKYIDFAKNDKLRYDKEMEEFKRTGTYKKMDLDSRLMEDFDERLSDDTEDDANQPRPSVKKSRLTFELNSVDTVGKSKKLEDGWELVAEDKEYQVLRRIHSGSIYEYRCSGIYHDISARAFIETQCDLNYRKTWDTNAITLEILESNPSNETETVKWVSKYPYPMAARVYYYVRRKKICENQKKIVVLSEVLDDKEHPTDKADKKFVRVTTYRSNMVVKAHKSLDEPGFDYVLTYYDDPQASIPNLAYSYIVSYGGPAYLKQVHDQAKKWEKAQAEKMAKKLEMPEKVVKDKIEEKAPEAQKFVPVEETTKDESTQTDDVEPEKTITKEPIKELKELITPEVIKDRLQILIREFLKLDKPEK